MPATTKTPYSTVEPLFGSSRPDWVPELEQPRLAAYDVYDDMYWNVPDTFKLLQRGDEQKPLMIPKPMTVVDTTSHYYLKGLTLTPETANELLQQELGAFLRREKFYSRFHIAKHSGVTRGDFVMHLTADPLMPEGRRLSLTSLDPRMYFPVYNDDDIDQLEKVHVVDQIYSQAKQTWVLRKLTYSYEVVGGIRRVLREQGVFELKDWFDPSKAKKIQDELRAELLPDPITTIPVYHFRNKEWQGDTYGSSELRGHERLMAAINQSMSDEEVALALDGLGVYHTDAPKPKDSEGQEVDWVIAPAKVLETTGGTFFKRVQGVGSVKPMQDHVGYLQATLHEASGTSEVALGNVDVNTAESGIALAIKFMPTLAKIEERDQAGVELLGNLFFDWRTMWMPAYEAVNLPDIEILPEIGEKLPTDRNQVLEELNNMLDRKIISKAYYREQVQKLGYEFPDDISQQILDELKAELEVQGQQVAAPGKKGAGDTLPNDLRSTSNNTDRPNESAGTEATQTLREQQSPARGRG